MALPGVNITRVNGETGGGTPATDKILVIGCFPNASSTETLQTFASIDAARTALGQSEATWDVEDMISSPNIPAVDVIAMTGSVAAAISTVTSGSGYPTCAVTSTSAGDKYPSFRDVKVRCSKAGGLTVARIQWSLDGGSTYSAERILPSDGAIVVPGVDLTMTFEDTTYTTDHSWSFRTDGKQLNTVDLATAEAVAKAANQRWPLKVYCTNFTSSSQGTTFFSAVDSDVTENAGYARRSTAIMHIGSGTLADIAQATTEVYASTGNGIDLVTGYGQLQLTNPFEACVKPMRPLTAAWAIRTRTVLDPGQDPSAFALGAISGLSSVDNDEFLDGQTLSDSVHRAIAWRTYPGNTSLIYPVSSWLHSNPISGFKWHQHDVLANIAEHTAYDALLLYVNSNVETQAGTGFLTARQSKKIETYVNSKLAAALLQGTNAQGGQGFLNDVTFSVNKAYDVATNEAIDGTLNLRPYGLVRNINLKLGIVA